jgi:copper chaperone CopZ
MRSMVLFSWLAAATLVACQQTPSNTAVEAAVPAVATHVAEFAIEGMVCEVGCKGLIEKKLKATPGVASCTIDFATGLARVEFDQSQVKPQDLTGVIESLADGKYHTGPVQETTL